MQYCWLATAVALGGSVACAGRVVGSDETGNTGDAVTADEVRSEAASLNQDVADCIGLSAADMQAGMSDFEEVIAAAEANGCLDVLADQIDCLRENARCVAPGEYTDNGACHDQEELAEDCRHGRL